MVTAVFLFPLARNQNEHFLPGATLCQAVVTVILVSAFEARPQGLSHRRVLGSHLPGHLLHQSPTFKQVYLLKAWLVFLCAML